jgi:enhancing lycopene biosynthesis protein 2
VSIGVLLGGCGHYDGSDPLEVAFTLLAIETAGERAILLAPDIAQERTVDHLSGEEMQGPRNVLRESARLARRPIRSLEAVRCDELEALLIPGGYGPVVNFSTGFARPGTRRLVHPLVAEFLGRCLDRGMPIGCVSLGEVPVRTLVGEDIEPPPPPPDPRSLTIHPTRPIVHTPGFTVFTRLVDVKMGIDALVAEVLRLVGERRRAAAVVHGAGKDA